MKLVVAALDEQWQNSGLNNINNVQWIRANAPACFLDHPDADAFFILQPTAVINYNTTKKPVFINSVTDTLQELNAGKNVRRINGWYTFLNRSLWEVAGIMDSETIDILESINKKAIAVADEPGLVAARIIAMLVNEAYFTLEDDVSSKKEIDIAMQAGTNYPYGLFDWAEKIGLRNIYTLLQKLSDTDKRCQPSQLLVNEALLNS
jgi:3-hydroxybutyryl-CoA dehydrogenase